MDLATANVLSELAKAIAAGNRVEITALAANLSSRPLQHLTPEETADLYRAIGQELAPEAVQTLRLPMLDAAIEAYLRALDAAAAGAPDPRQVLADIDALIPLLLTRAGPGQRLNGRSTDSSATLLGQWRAVARRLAAIAVELARIIEGDDSPALAERERQLTSLFPVPPAAPVAASAPQPAAPPMPAASPATAESALPPEAAKSRDAVRTAGSGLESAGGLERARSGLESSAAEASADDNAEAPTPDYQKVDVYFATSRQGTPSANPYTRFTGRRNAEPGKPLHTYGIAEVSIPRQRTVGSLPTPNWFQRHPGFHSDELYLLKQIRALSEADWQKAMSGDLASRGKREALIYVHGYNIPFWGAMVRAAQLHADLDIDGVVAAYSWPSRGNILYYLTDRQELIAPHYDELKRMIRTIASLQDIGRITVVAHSMGCEFLLQALERLQLELAADKTRKMPLIKDVIFAAPDVDVAHFAGVVPKLDLAERITVYTSEKDQALSWGRWLVAAYDRAGNNPARLVTALAGLTDRVDTIDTTEMTQGGLGHSDYSTTAIDDVRALIWLSLMPQRRPTLIQRYAPNGGPGYWVYRGADSARETTRQAMCLARQCGGVREALAALQTGSMLAFAGQPLPDDRRSALARALTTLT